MTILNRLVAVTAGLCLLAGAAAAAAEGVHIAYTGLDLAQPKDAATFKARVDKASRAFCDANMVGGERLGALRECRQAVWDEAVSQLPATTQDQLQQALAVKPAPVTMVATAH